MIATNCCNAGICKQCGEAVPKNLSRYCPKGPKAELSKPITIVATIRKPKEPQSQRMYLGDYTERLFASVGLTQEHYIEAKKELGLSPTCNCPERIEWLNNLHKWALKKLNL